MNTVHSVALALNTWAQPLRSLDDGLGGNPEPPAGFTAEQIGPGILGFIFLFAVTVALIFLIRDMVRRLRNVRMAGEAQERRQAEAGVADAAGEASAAGDAAGEPATPTGAAGEGAAASSQNGAGAASGGDA